MKTSKILSIGALAFAALMFSACSDKDKDFIPPALDEGLEGPVDESEFNQIDYTPHVDGDPFDTYKGLVMAGYQGWFGCPGDGCSHSDASNTQWYHYRENDRFQPGVLQNSIDMWPDMREYEKGYDTSFKYPDGTTAQVYSAYDESSVRLHFKWMQQYGIDGVYMQRFVGEVIDNPQGKDHFNKVLQSAMKASNEYQRAIAVMYDLGGYNEKKAGEKIITKADILADLKELNDTYHFTDRAAGQKYYLYENGRPVVTIWGVGFTDRTPSKFTMQDISELIDGFNRMGFSVMLGVTTYWRTGGGDTVTPVTELLNVIKKADIIMPWLVGRFGYNTYDNFKERIAGDIKWAKENGVLYAPLCYPGSTDLHMHPNYGPNEGRYGGQFFWNQIHHCVTSGAEALYIAMFDEIDEGTAIYKVLNEKDVPSNVPTNNYWIIYQNGSTRWSANKINDDLLKEGEWQVQGSEIGKGIPYDTGHPDGIPFYGIEDNLPTDHYLWLTGQAREMLNGRIKMSLSLPVR